MQYKSPSLYFLHDRIHQAVCLHALPAFATHPPNDRKSEGFRFCPSCLLIFSLSASYRLCEVQSVDIQMYIILPVWNCGAEGNSRKKAVNELRKNQIFNAFFLLLFAQGMPCILSGDEFMNTQKGNNNAYCQDNLISWLDWNQLSRQEELLFP